MSPRRRNPRNTAGVLASQDAPSRSSRVLLVGDDSGIDLLCGMLETLPRKARGRAFLEVATAADIRAVDAPGGVTVTWLTRDSRRDGLAMPGELLDRAVRAWLSEMIVTAEHAQDLSPWFAGDAYCIESLRRTIAAEQVGQA